MAPCDWSADDPLLSTALKAPPPTSPWCMTLDSDGTLRLEVSSWGMLTLNRWRVLGLVAVTLVWAVTFGAAVLGMLYPFLDPQRNDASVIAKMMAIIFGYPLFMALLFACLFVGAVCGPRAVHIGPQRWHASINGRIPKGAEGCTSNLVVRTFKRKASGLLGRLLGGWDHAVHLEESGTTAGRFFFLLVPHAGADFSDVEWLAGTIREAVLRCGGAAQPGPSLGERDEVPDPALPPTSRWVLQRNGEHCRLQLPQTAWSQTHWIFRAFLVDGLVLAACALFIACMSPPNTPSKALSLTTFFVCSLGLALYSGAVVLREMSPRVLELGPEVYTARIGWPWLTFVQRTGVLRNLHAQEHFQAAHGCVDVDKDFANVKRLRPSLRLEQDGVRGQINFWTVPYRYFAHDEDRCLAHDEDRTEVMCLIAIIEQHVRAAKQRVALM